MTEPKNILITGGTGFIGGYLCELLAREGHYLTLISRSPEKYKEEAAKNQQYIGWDDDLSRQMEKTDVVINLAGENLFGQRWTDEVKSRLYNSRIDITRDLVDAMAKAENKPSLFISASAVGYYGHRGDEILDESEPEGDDFLAGICKDWEAEAERAKEYGIRVVNPRIGIALEEDGGVIEQMKFPFTFFVGGSLGSGDQFVPWIYMQDLCRAIAFPIQSEEFEGPYNACSPNPETMSELASAMGRVMNRPSFFKVPEFALKIALGEAATPVLASLRAQPKKLQIAGFEFQFEDLEESLADIL